MLHLRRMLNAAAQLKVLLLKRILLKLLKQLTKSTILDTTVSLVAKAAKNAASPANEGLKAAAATDAAKPVVTEINPFVDAKPARQINNLENNVSLELVKMKIKRYLTEKYLKKILKIQW